MDKEKILHEVNKGLSFQFDTVYTWENMIDDLDLTDEEKSWAKENITFKAYIRGEENGYKTSKKQIVITEDEITLFVKRHYYCDDKFDTVWYPFEYEEPEQIEEHIENDVYALIGFLEDKGIKIKE